MILSRETLKMDFHNMNGNTYAMSSIPALGYDNAFRLNFS